MDAKVHGILGVGVACGFILFKAPGTNQSYNAKQHLVEVYPAGLNFCLF